MPGTDLYETETLFSLTFNSDRCQDIIVPERGCSFLKKTLPFVMLFDVMLSDWWNKLFLKVLASEFHIQLSVFMFWILGSSSVVLISSKVFFHNVEATFISLSLWSLISCFRNGADCDKLFSILNLVSYQENAGLPHFVKRLIDSTFSGCLCPKL